MQPVIKNILLTGSSGTIGTALYLKLYKKFNIFCVDKASNIWNSQIKTTKINLKNSLTLNIKIDLIIHLAANARVHDSVVNPQLALENYLTTYNVLELARKNKIKRIIYASSREVYGIQKINKKITEKYTNITNMASPYSASKLGSEALINSYEKCYSIKPLIIRFSNVYGKYDVSERVVPLWIKQAIEHKDITIFDNKKKLSFTYIDDTIIALEKCILKFDKIAPLTLNIAGVESVPLLKVAKQIIRNTKSKSKLLVRNKRVGEICFYNADISIMKNKLKYIPTTKIEEGIKLSIEWYKKVKTIPKILRYQNQNLKKRNLI